MAIQLDPSLSPTSLVNDIERVFELSAQKIRSIHKAWHPDQGTPVFTVNGRYTARGWTEWTQGFQFGSALLQYEATGEKAFLAMGRLGTLRHMASHVSHVGVHDHGFNNISTYGAWLRLMREGRIPESPAERSFCELALKASGAVQASRWTRLADGTGFIYSFNGPHSLFVDTIRSCRVLAVAHQLGHLLMGEQDARISLLERLVQHSVNTARYNIYYGQGRDAYDVRGRTAHEAVFNVVSGTFRCPNSQQGYSPFTTWTRGLAWAILGFSEELEFFDRVPTADFRPFGGRAAVASVFLRAATATADFYIENSCTDGVPLWDTGAPNLWRMGAFLDHPANPFNDWEPVDSSAAAIAAQGLLRLGHYLQRQRRQRHGLRYWQAGLRVASTLFKEPYLSTSSRHQGLLLHSVYHRPNGWDHVHRGQRVPNGESSMWGDYHLRELALYLWRLARGENYLTFFDPTGQHGPA